MLSAIYLQSLEKLPLWDAEGSIPQGGVKLWRRGSEGGHVHEHGNMKCPTHFSQPRKGHAGKLGPSICQADIMKMEMSFNGRPCLQRSQPEWKEARQSC